jgi:hypothetical protein
MRTHYGPWQPCWISNQHQKQKSGSRPSNKHFWQVWFNSVLWFQRRRFKCEKLTDGRTLTHDKSSHGLWPGELIKLFDYLNWLWQVWVLIKATCYVQLDSTYYCQILHLKFLDFLRLVMYNFIYFLVNILYTIDLHCNKDNNFVVDQ